MTRLECFTLHQGPQVPVGGVLRSESDGRNLIQCNGARMPTRLFNTLTEIGARYGFPDFTPDYISAFPIQIVDKDIASTRLPVIPEAILICDPNLISKDKKISLGRDIVRNIVFTINTIIKNGYFHHQITLGTQFGLGKEFLTISPVGTHLSNGYVDQNLVLGQTSGLEGKTASRLVIFAKNTSGSDKRLNMYFYPTSLMLDESTDLVLDNPSIAGSVAPQSIPLAMQAATRELPSTKTEILTRKTIDELVNLFQTDFAAAYRYMNQYAEQHFTPPSTNFKIVPTEVKRTFLAAKLGRLDVRFLEQERERGERGKREIQLIIHNFNPTYLNIINADNLDVYP